MCSKTLDDEPSMIGKLASRGDTASRMKRSKAKRESAGSTLNENAGTNFCSGNEWNASVIRTRNASVGNEKNRSATGRQLNKNIHGPSEVEADGSALSPLVTFASLLSLAFC